MSIYITDKNGKVIFDSDKSENIGKDFNKWRDVKLTLAGGYGARTTRIDPADSKSAVLYVAAPIRVDGRIEGALTIAKPTTNINNFLDNAQPRFLKVSLVSFFAAMVLSLLATLWIIRPIKPFEILRRRYKAGQKGLFAKAGPNRDRRYGFCL